MIISSSILIKRNVSYKRCRENENTQFVFNNPPPSKFVSFLDNVEKCGRARRVTYENVIRRNRLPCRVTKVTDTLSNCNTYCFSTVTMVTRTRLDVTLNEVDPSSCSEQLLCGICVGARIIRSPVTSS